MEDLSKNRARGVCPDSQLAPISLYRQNIGQIPKIHTQDNSTALKYQVLSLQPFRSSS